MILHDYLRVLRRGWWVIAVFAILGAAAGAAISAVIPPNYYASSTVYVTTVGDATPGELQSGNVFAIQRVATYADLATTTSVLARAASSLGGGTDVSDLRESVTAGERPDTSLIDISVSGEDPVVVAARANAVAEALAVEVTALDGLDVASPLRLSIVEAAIEPQIAATPQPRTNVFVGAAVGLALGLGLVVVRHALDSRIRTLADLPRTPGIASLTSIPIGRARSTRGGGSDARVESFRTLRANLQFGTQTGRTIAVAGVTSASDSRAVARQLAVALGEIGSTVVVVDLDLRPGDAGKHSKRKESAPAEVGVAEVLAGKAALQQAVTAGPAENVFMIPAGKVNESSAQLLSTQPTRQMLDELMKNFAYVILSCPPLVERSESAVAAALASSSLMVVDSGVTTRSEFLFALELLAGVRVSSISVAIDGVRDLDVVGGSTGVIENQNRPNAVTS